MRYVLILAVLLTACGAAGGGGGEPSASESATAPPAQPSGGGESITGTFGGDAQLEGGCAWIDDGSTKWQVEWPQGYAVTFDPLTLTGPDGVTASEGDTITVEGSERTDAMTICQVGPLWTATSVTVE